MMNSVDVLMRIRQNEWLSQVAQFEPFALKALIEDALSHQSGVERWRHYERLKKQAKGMSGCFARRDELASSEHYQAMITLIDEILPVTHEDDVCEDHLGEDDQGWEREGSVVSLADAIDEFMADLDRRRRERGYAS